MVGVANASSILQAAITTNSRSKNQGSKVLSCKSINVFLNRWIEKKSDDEVFNWVKICALVHVQIVVYGNIKETFKSQSVI